jgi:hypothetical protein
VTRSRSLLAGVGVLAAVLGALAVAQLLLPGLAASRLRDQLSRDGSVQRVTVHAFPAVELLWGHADSVTVSFDRLTASRARTGELLGRAVHVGRLSVTAGIAREGPLLLRRVSLHKDGPTIAASALVTDAALRDALPAGFSAQPVASGAGQLLLRARASLFGLGLAVDALVAARNGALVIQPVGVPLASLATVTVFSDPHVAVQSVGAGRVAGGYAVSTGGRLVG